MSVRAYVWQRGTAVLLVALIAVHLGVIFYATGKQLTAADILARTRGSIPWALFYGTFVVAAAIHASIGIQAALVEWLSFSRRGARIFGGCFGATLVTLGLRAVTAVVL
jgi:fumarate reductase subunit C